MSDEFIEDNKQALLEEMARALNNLNEFVNDYINLEPNENTLIDLMTLYGGMSNQVGYLTSTFNQFYVLFTGVVPKNNTKEIGFKSLLKKEEE